MKKYEVSDEIVISIQKYGDARADSGDSATAIMHCINLIRAARATAAVNEVDEANERDVLRDVVYELAALIEKPHAPTIDQWPCKNDADRECLQKAYVIARAALATDAIRPCTCHPDDNPPVPCAQQYALNECRASTDAAKGEAKTDIFEWLDTEISAIDTWYRGSPTYEHDAGWMKSEVLRLVAKARETFAAPEVTADDARERVPELFKSSLTPFGMLIRALRIVAKKTLGDMAKFAHMSSADLSNVEMGRKPLTDDLAIIAAEYFHSVGIVGTLPAIYAALAAQNGEKS